MYVLKKGIEGSNPSLSTILRQGFVWQAIRGLKKYALRSFSVVGLAWPFFPKVLRSFKTFLYQVHEKVQQPAGQLEDLCL
jgi:hypothetical protein